MRSDESEAASGAPVAVLGARGFIGRAVTTALTERGVPTILRTSDHPAVRASRLDPAVAHAATVIVAIGRSNPALAEREVDTATRELTESRELFRLLSEARQDLPGRQRVLIISSGGTVYDTSYPPPYAETSPTARSSAYSRLKLDIEDAFLAVRSPTSEHTVIRLSNVYGSGQRLGTGQGVVGHWFQALAARQPIRLFGDPETVRDYVYVDDVAAAISAAHSAPTELPPVLNVGSGEPTSLRHLLRLVLKAVGTPEHPVDLVPDRPFDRRHTWLDVGEARRVLGWTPTTGLEEGLKQTWRQFSSG